MLSQDQRTFKTYKQYNLRLNKTSEADLIEHLDSMPNKRQFFIKAIRKDMEN